MDAHLFNQLLMFSAEAIVTALLILGLFWLRTRFGLSLLFVTLGVFQPLQVLLASSIYVEVLPGVAVSPGSIILFTASLFAVLLVYIREGVIETRKVIYGIMVANLTMTLLLVLFGAQLTLPDTFNFLSLSPAIFNQGARVMLTGSIVLFADVLLVIIVYEWMRRLIPKIPFLRIYMTMVVVLVFDSLGFATGAFLGQPLFKSVLLAGSLGKTVMALYYAAALSLYLRFIEPEQVSLKNAEPVPDIFYALTYREKYEIERQRVEAERLASEERAKALLESIPDLIFKFNRQGEFLDYQAAVDDLLYVSPEEFIGKKVDAVLPPEIAETTLNKIQQVLERGEIQVFEYMLPMGEDERIFEARYIPSGVDEVIAISRDITARKRAEETLRESEANLKSLIDNREDYIWALDRNYDYIVFNNIYAQFYLALYKNELKKGMNAVETLTSEEYEFWIPKYESVFAGENITFELSYPLNGQLHYFRVSLNPIYAGDTIVGVSAINSDITERKQAEQALRESEEKFRSILDSITEPVFVHDALTGAILDVNQSMVRKFGYTREEARKIDVETISSGEPGFTQQDAMRWMEKALRGEPQIFEWRSKTKSGELFWSEVNMRLALIGADQRIIVSVRDITERKQAEEKLHKLNARLINVFETMGDAFVSLDEHWVYTYVNERAGQIFGRTPQSLIGKHIWTEFPEGVGQPFYKAYYQAVETQQPITIEEFYPPYNRWFENRIYPSSDGLAIFFTDITDFKASEKALQEAHARLEERVRERTDELQRVVNLMAGREIRMKELRDVIKQLRAQLSEAGLKPVADDSLKE